jgi:hypothetical protein
VTVVEASLHLDSDEDYVIFVEYGGGDPSGLTVRTQARHTSGSYCEYILSIRDYFGTVSVDTYFNTDDGWSDWIAMQVPRNLEFAVVEIHPATLCSSGSGTADVRIELES